jgi:hypothetical protein
MKTQNKESQTDNKTKSSASSSDKIKTDMPLSEKDEVKDAEKRTRKSSKEHL